MSSQPSSQYGFSLVEALVVLVVSALLMSVFSQVYLSSERAHRHLQDYSEDNRSAFYARQQLRAWLSAITVPPEFGRTEIDLGGTFGPETRNAAVPLQPFIGERTGFSGYLRETLLGQDDIRAFKVSAIEPYNITEGQLPGTVELTFDDETIGPLWLGINRARIRGFAYFDQTGNLHPSWPPSADGDQAGARRDQSALTVEDALGVSTTQYWLDKVPSGILIEFGTESQRSMMVIDVTP